MKGEKLPMRINLLSSFAAGILITTTICSIVYFSDKKDVPNASAKTSENKIVKVQPSEKDMKKKLVTKGYVVQTKDEYDKNMKAAKAAEQKQAPAENSKSNKNVTKVVVNVSEGMTSIDVANMLVKANLIPNALHFSQDIEKKGLDRNLRPGVYVVDSEMTSDQVIDTIFKK
jgi:hypothetical protein